MDKKTLHKILQDPDFNPAIFLEQAIVDFVSRNPEKVAEDAVALRHLIGDTNVAPRVFKLVEINDLHLVKTYLKAIRAMQGYYDQGSALRQLTSKLHRLHKENVAEMVKMLKENVGKIAGLNEPSSLVKIADIMNKDDLEEMIVMTLKSAGTDWKVDDWDVATKIDVGITKFIMKMKEMSINEEEMFNFMSRLAHRVKGTEFAPLLLDKIKEKWSTYICFKCGKGKGPWRAASWRPPKGKNDFIKSISGYTLHRKTCDPKDEFPSPHEIITGRPMELEWECERGCGATFTTSSGKTLHEKKCRY